MQPTVYQKPEIRDANDNIIQQGAFGKNTALANATNDGWIDYVANDLEFLYDLAKDEVVPVPSLPASGQTNKTYLLTTTGVSYRWSGTEWVAVSSSEAVGRAESAANLAEQWATKTDGTVDGTEYSAKYYAQQAEASADDAQDTADDMATHLVQIDKNTGGVSANSKRISNIEKLLQGNLYDYDTDDDSAYTKTVPSGALPYAGVEKLGGKTIVYNQNVKNGNFESTDYWEQYASTISVANNVITCVCDGSSTTQGFRSTANGGEPLVVGHKYYISAECRVVDNALTVDFYLPYSRSEAFGTQIINVGNAWVKASYIKSALSSRAFDSAIGVRQREAVACTFEARNLQVIDLTLMFGSGNEPSTVAEFEAMFPAQYYPYNAGTLLSAGVTEVESVGKNLLDVMNPWRYGNNFYNLEIGAQLVGNSPTFKPTDNKDGTFTFTPETGWYGFIFLAEVDMSKTYKFYAQSQATSNRTTLYLLDSDHKILWKSNPGTGASQTLTVSFGGAETTYTQAKYFAFAIGTGSGGTTITITNPQLEVGSTATAYVPHIDITMPIPAEVKALEGYGWSAGTAYNYVDLERKVFVKRVGAVDLGSLTWSYNSSQARFLSPITGMAKPTDTAGRADGIICKLYVPSMDVISNPSSVNMAMARYTDGNIYIRNSAYTDTPTFKSAMSGVYLYYELATPIETDISAYLTDNLIEVGAGGTLTFPNANGDDYHIPVPSEVTYMIDLQEAIENGN